MDLDRENPPDLQVEGWLKTLGIESLCQWDVLVFLYRHPISLFGAEHLAGLLGYAQAIYAARDEGQEANEAASMARAHAMALEALGPDAFTALHAEGISLRDPEIGPMAFAERDA